MVGVQSQASALQGVRLETLMGWRLRHVRQPMADKVGPGYYQAVLEHLHPLFVSDVMLVTIN